MALDIFNTFATDTAAEVEGVEIEFSGTNFLIARAGNPKYSRMLSKLVDKNQKALNLKNEAADALSDKILIDVIATTILLGWDDLTFKSENLPYSLENAKMILGFKDFRREIARMSEDVDNYKVVKEDEEAKN